MYKRSSKLALNRETLRRLDAGDLSWARGRDEISFQSGETHCWCTDSCDTNEQWDNARGQRFQRGV